VTLNRNDLTSILSQVHFKYGIAPSNILSREMTLDDVVVLKLRAGFISDSNKAGFAELPDSSKFIYSLETKTAKKTLKKVWKNPQAKKEVLAGLGRMDRGELLPRN